MTPLEVVSAFIERINNRDVDGAYELLEEDHVFIDGLGNSVIGRDAVRDAWRAYFAMVPDYRINVDRVLEKGQVIAIFGRAGGTVSRGGRLDAGGRWEVPAAWQAVVRGQGLAVWQVFADNEPMRQIMAKWGPEPAAT